MSRWRWPFWSPPGSGTRSRPRRRIVAVIPWRRFKAAFVTLIDRLPAPLVLLIFLVPFLIVEPLLVVATVAIAMGYVFWGAVAWIVLKALAIAVLPAIFDLTKHRLMTMPWFVWVFDKVMAFHRLRPPDRRALQARGQGAGRAMAGERVGAAARPIAGNRPARRALRRPETGHQRSSLRPRRRGVAVLTYPR